MAVKEAVSEAQEAKRRWEAETLQNIFGPIDMNQRSRCSINWAARASCAEVPRTTIALCKLLVNKRGSRIVLRTSVAIPCNRCIVLVGAK